MFDIGILERTADAPISMHPLLATEHTSNRTRWASVITPELIDENNNTTAYHHQT